MIEDRFRPAFAAALSLREKQIQQSYRPVIGVHKWFARRPGSLFRSLLLAEFDPTGARLEDSYFRGHDLKAVIADPFMGGGTPLYEANRLGLQVVGADVNPMACWVVRQSLAPLDLKAFQHTAAQVIDDVEAELGDLYRTACVTCGADADLKYVLWVKIEECPNCAAPVDLFPGYLLAENVRHPRWVVICPRVLCGALNELERRPTLAAPATCSTCRGPLHTDRVPGHSVRGGAGCHECGTTFVLPPRDTPHPHRPWAIEYHCKTCKQRRGRAFKRPDAADLARVARAATLPTAHLPIPDSAIPPGDETRRLYRWGLKHYRDLFGARQLAGLGRLLARIIAVPDPPVRHALLTVFSDFLRYQNRLCRYDTYALKCQDIFSVHGFPVGRIECENNLLGIPKVGSGSFRHFVEKYVRAKAYCAAPFEIRGKITVPIAGESIEARFQPTTPRKDDTPKRARLESSPAAAVKDLGALDGVFTDPPYFDAVQYAELMDFCFAWLRLGLAQEMPAFAAASTRSPNELTGNATENRDLAHFTAGLSEVFAHYARALRPGAPFVFTYHHQDPGAYLPLVVAILDAGLVCTATLPAVGEMGASLHLARTEASAVDTVFVCRAGALPNAAAPDLSTDAAALIEAGLPPSPGDLRCLAAGHIARLAIAALHPHWDASQSLPTRMAKAREALAAQVEAHDQTEAIVALQLQTPGRKHVRRASVS